MDDEFDVRTLPANFVSKSRPSQIIDRLLEKRRIAHNEAVEEMEVRKRDVNVEIEDEMRNHSGILKSKLGKIKEDVEYYLLSLRNTKEIDVKLEKRPFEKANKKIVDANDTRRKAVDEFYRRLVNLDKQRTDQFKLILNETFAKLQSISHELPFKLEEFFEKEMLKINQITVNNFEQYAELQSEVQLQIENDTRLWLQVVYEVREKIKRYQRAVARESVVSRLNLSHSLTHILSQAQLGKEMEDFGSLQSELENQLDQIKFVPVIREDVENWLQETRNALAALDRSAKNIVDIYRAAIVIIFNRFFEELDDIKKSLFEDGMVDENEIAVFDSEFYTPSVDELNIKYQLDFENLQALWDEVIQSMRKCVDDTYVFLRDSAYLFDLHFLRIEEASQLVKRDVKNAVQKNSVSAEIFEGKLNILVDKLRQGPTEQKLERSLLDVKKTLDNLQKLYNSQSSAEMKVVQKYRTMVSIEVDVLMSELTRFLTIYPADEERDPKKQRKRASQTSELEIDPTEEMIPMQMLFCKFQVDAVKNWQFGLWEAIDQYVNVGRAEIMLTAEDWITAQFQKVNERLMVKLAFHKPRYQRVVCSVYEKRLYELERHASRFASHKTAVELEIRKLKENIKVSEEKYNDICKTFKEEADKIDQRIINTKNSGQVRRQNTLLKKSLKDAVDSMNNIICENSNLSNKLMEDLKLANMRFAKAMKFYSEGGNYTIDEAKSLLKNLKKLEKTTAKSLALINKEDKAKQAKYSAKLDAEKSEISASILELIQEHEHNEMSVLKIQKLQGDIRADVIDLKRGTKILEAPFKKLVEVSTKSLGQHEYIDTFSHQLGEIARQLIDQATYLLHPDPVVMYSSVSVGSQSRGVDTSKPSFRDYTTLLFAFKPSKAECFMSKLNNHLYHSLQDIQLKAKEFYTIHDEPLLDSSKMQPSYDGFMDEVLEKYKKYLIQCEICWAENVSEFLNFVNDFLRFKDQYLSTFESKFYNISHDYCSTVMEGIAKQLREDREDMKNKFHAVHDKLKALYGHPNNRHLLEQIDTEFKEFVAENEEKLNCMLEPYKDTLTEENETVKEIFNKTNEVLKDLSKDDILSFLRSKLNEQLTMKLEFMRDMMECDEASEVSINENNELLLSNHAERGC